MWGWILKRLPTKLKILKGTKQNCRENPNEPDYPVEIPDAPDHLDKEALIEWGRVTHLLHSQGLISKLDRAMLSAYCESWSMYVKASIELTKQGLTVETTNGNMIQNPLVGIVNQSKKHMKDFASEFGMSPVSKARVSAKESEKKSDPWEKFG